MEWNEHTQLRLRIDNLKGKIKEAFPQRFPHKDAQITMDLAKLWRGLNIQFGLLDQEAVECRRRQKATAKYLELRADIEARIQFIDKRVTWGLML